MQRDETYLNSNNEGYCYNKDSSKTKSQQLGPGHIANRWSFYERHKFIQLVKQHGKDFKKIAEEIGTKDEKACMNRGMNLLFKMRNRNFPMDQELYDKLAKHKYSGNERRLQMKKEETVIKVNVVKTETKDESVEEIEEIEEEV